MANARVWGIAGVGEWEHQKILLILDSRIIRTDING